MQNGGTKPMTRWMARAAIAVSFVVGAQGASAQYYIGPSYLQLPGLSGGAKEGGHKGWVRTEAHYWTKAPALREIRGITGAASGLQFTGSRAPAKGPDMLAISVDKANPAFQPLMDQCRRGAAI